MPKATINKNYLTSAGYPEGWNWYLKGSWCNVRRIDIPGEVLPDLTLSII